MKIGVVADTHDNLTLVRDAVAFFEEQAVDTVIHCGDVVAPFAARLFDGDFDFYCVRGNNDGEEHLADAVEEVGTWLDGFHVLTLDDETIAVYHGTYEEIVESLVASGRYDYVLRGHTHERTLENHNGTVEINPGGIPIAGAEESFSVAVLDTETGSVDFEEC